MKTWWRLNSAIYGAKKTDELPDTRMKPSILLVNPPIYDFSAYDFWLKPYGMLRVAGFLRRRADFQLFDFMDRFDPRVPEGKYRSDPWGRGLHCRVRRTSSGRDRRSLRSRRSCCRPRSV